MSAPKCVAAGLAVLLVVDVSRAADLISNPFIGITHIQRHDTSTFGRPVFINALEIDLQAPGLSFQLTPFQPGGPVRNGVPDEMVTETTRQYVDRVNAQVGINASFFRLEHHSMPLWTNNNSLAVSNGHAFSPWEGSLLQALNITQDNQASIVRAAASRPTGFETVGNPQLWNAVAGNVDLLVNNSVVPHEREFTGSNMRALNPRTAVGVSQDGRYLYMVTADGRQTGFSNGVFLDEMGTLMQSFGAYNAINLDGGGSTTMAFDYYRDADSNGMPVRSRLINSPVGRGTVGSERYNGANLAVFALDNPNFVPPPGPTVPPPQVTMVADFETTAAPFTNPGGSGSNRGVAASSTFPRTGGDAFEGMWKQEIRLNYNTADTTGQFRYRHLAGGGTPSNNVQLGNEGFVGFFLKVAAGDIATGDFKVAILIDDQDTTAASPAGTERGVYLDVIADGEWHLYEWDLGDSSRWVNFAGGNGIIDRPVTTIDGIYFDGDLNRTDVVFYLDAVAYNATGSLQVLVPEPASLAFLCVGGLIALRRRR